MKKIILLFAVIISVSMISCQTDDDAGPADTQDKFIGNWKITQEFENGVEVSIPVCNLEDRLTVTADQKFTSVLFDIENGNCVLYDTRIGSWENLRDNIYRISFDTNPTASREITITFSENTATLVFNTEFGELIQILTRI
ncbi:lipocalin family protein [uncultured Aquimarina sp.]|uniref:lipocalin family protein n=1 Tax=uncultured Aquimarina sp. TaxID=575652 RepID=UPI0026119095|nr:lipocalin family protein [uncultured Aquimarina sp.]